MPTVGFTLSGSLPALLALLIGVAGWFYLFYSRAAANLATVEAENLNRRRMRLRRAGGVVMLLLAVGIAVGSYGFDVHHPGAGFLILWLVVMVLLFAMMYLGLVDLRLTQKLKHSLKRNKEQ